MKDEIVRIPPKVTIPIGSSVAEWPPRPFELGSCMASGKSLTLSWQELSVHLAVLGGSGSGKSKLLELLLRQLMIDGIGFLFVDPHGDTAKDLAAFAVAQKVDEGIKNDTMWRKIDYFTIAPGISVSIDPFADAPPLREGRLATYASWLDTKVDFLVRAILRRFSSADVDAMNRLVRWMRNVLYFCGIAQDEQNTHHGIDKMLIAANPQDPRFFGLMSVVETNLKWLYPGVYADFEKLIQTRRPIDQERWVESTINNLLRLDNTLIREMFSQRVPAIDIPGIMRNGGHLIADLGQSGHSSEHQKFMIGGLLIQEVLHAKYMESMVAREDRKPFVLIIDECGEFLGEDLQTALGAQRKFNLPIVLAAQNLASFAKGDMDLAPKVLSQCGTVVTFQQTYRPDKEAVADRVGTSMLDFTPLLHEVQRHRGYITKKVIDRSISGNKTIGRSLGGGLTSGWTHGSVVGEMISTMENFSESMSHGRSQQTSSGYSGTSSTSNNRGTSTSPMWEDDKIRRFRQTQSEGQSHNESSGFSQGETSGVTENETETHGFGRTKGENRSRSTGHSGSRSENWSDSKSDGEGWSISERTVEQPNLVSEWDWSGLYESGTPQIQFEKLMKAIHCLSVAESIISRRGETQSYLMKVRQVKDWFDAKGKGVAFRNFILKLRDVKEYYFNPNETFRPQRPGFPSQPPPNASAPGPAGPPSPPSSGPQPPEKNPMD